MSAFKIFPYSFHSLAKRIFVGFVLLLLLFFNIGELDLETIPLHIRSPKKICKKQFRVEDSLICHKDLRPNNRAQGKGYVGGQSVMSALTRGAMISRAC